MIIKKYNILLFIIFALLLPSCFLRMSSNEVRLNSYVGKNYKLLRNIITAGGISTPIAFEEAEKNLFIFKKQFKFVIPSNSTIKVIGVVQRRLDAGINYYFVCFVEETEQKFDLQFEMRDCLGIR